MENNKFTPIAMKCNEAQFKEVEPILKDNGLEILDIDTFDKSSYLINNYSNRKGEISNVPNKTKGSYNRKVYEEWDKETFLKACGIEIEPFVLPEYWCVEIDADNFKELESYPYMYEKNGIQYIASHDCSDRVFAFQKITYEQYKKYVVSEPQEQPPLKKFINLSSKETAKKETVFTHVNMGGDWFGINSNLYKEQIKKIFYHGELEANRGSLFVAELNDGKLVILKGIKGDEFND